MSFQKAHQVSNELGEVVVTSSEFALNQADGTAAACNFPAPFKTYRVLEVGFVVANNVASDESTFVNSVKEPLSSLCNSVFNNLLSFGM